MVRKELLAKAGGSEVIYFSSSDAQPVNDIRLMFAKLAKYVEQQVSWKRPDKLDVYEINGDHHEDRRFSSSS